MASPESASTHGWGAARLKFVAPLRNERAPTTSDHPDYLGLENIESWTGRVIEGGPRSNDITDNDLGLSNSFREGDILFGKLRPYLAKACQAPRDGGCSTELLVMQPTQSLHPRFLLYCLLTPDFIGAVDASTFGAKMPRANWEFIGSLEIHIPPIKTQLSITAYLDRETGRIDTLIAEKERMLALLEEKRAALISRIVTRGLNPDAPLKDSGQEWLGMIPAHWNPLRLKHAIDRVDQGSSPQCHSYSAEPGQWGVLKTGCVNGGVFRESENKVLPEDADPLPEAEVHQGDVLISRASGSVDLIGSVAYVAKQPLARLLLSDKIYRLRPNPRLIEPQFLALAMQAHYLRRQIKASISGADGLANNIAKSDIMDLVVIVPPLNEQKMIVNQSVEISRVIASLRENLKISNALLKERRMRTITDAVTGLLSTEYSYFTTNPKKIN